MPKIMQLVITKAIGTGVPSPNKPTKLPDKAPAANPLEPNNAEAVPLLVGKNSMVLDVAFDAIKLCEPINSIINPTTTANNGASTIET